MTRHTGFYRRRRGILEHLENGDISLFDAGVHDFICLNAQSQVNSGSAIPPGIWFGSATKIFNICGTDCSLRTVRRSLEKLEQIGWIRRFMPARHRGSYPILIARWIVRDRVRGDFIVNAEKSNDWRHPILEPVRDVADSVADGMADLLQEVRIKKEEKPRAQIARASRLAKEAEVGKELVVGSLFPFLPERPKEGSVRKAYLEFLELRDTNQIPRETTWSTWSTLSDDERKILRQKPGPVSVESKAVEKAEEKFKTSV